MLEGYHAGDLVDYRIVVTGYVHKGTSAPDICPACVHPQAYFEVFVEAY
jgi:rubrerythrin